MKKDKIDQEIDDVQARLLKRRRAAPIPPDQLLSTGSTLVNLACTGRTLGGLVKGLYFWVCGDSDSGKTWLVLSCLAEASINPNFSDYKLVYDDIERGALMDLPAFFGSAMAERLEPPARDQEGNPIYSDTIQSFYYHIDSLLNGDKPVLYILDSMDALDSDQAGSKFQQQKTAYEKGNEAPGSYGDGKAKENSANIRRVCNRLKKNGSILIIISQTRDNLGFGAQFSPKVSSGGNALQFYANIVLWLSVRKKLTKNIRGKERQIGVLSQIQVKRTRITGAKPVVTVPIFRSHGVDDIGSMVEWLVDEAHWEKNKQGIITAPDFDFKGRADQLIKKIEEEELEVELRALTGRVWQEIEAACVVERKPRYPMQ
jgi:recA bacterial DNA recombination protein